MKKIVLLLAVLLFVSSAFAQSDTGRPVLETFQEVSPYESINLYNLSIVIHAPVLSRGGPMPLDFGLALNVQTWPGWNGSSHFWQSYPIQGGPSSGLGVGPINSGSNYNQQGFLYDLQPTYCPDGVTQTNEIIPVSILDTYTTTHLLSHAPLNAQSAAAWDSKHCLTDLPIDVVTVDGSGLELTGTLDDPPIFTVYDNNGVYVSSANANHILDPHGNQIIVTEGSSAPYTITATGPLSTTPLISYPDATRRTGSAVGNPISYNYTDGTGAQRNVTVTYQAGHPYSTAWSCPGWVNEQSSATYYPLQSIAWPDGSSVGVTWEMTGTNYTGRITSVSLPTGATASYGYSGGTSGQGWWCTSTQKLFPATITRAIGGGTSTFAITLDANYATNDTTYTTVMKPDGSKTVYTFVHEFQTNKVTYDTNGTTVLDTVKTCYNTLLANCAAEPYHSPTVFWTSPFFSSVATYHYVPGVANPSGVVTFYDQYGNVTEVDRYDFGPTLVNKTITQYGTWNGSTCAAIGNHIQNKPCDVQVQDASSNVLSHSRFDYSSTGDMLHEYDYYTSTNYLTTTHTYNANGTVASVTAADGVQTTVSNTQCNGFLTDSATNAIGTASMTWDCNGAIPLTTTDLNGLVTTTTYGDPLYRPTQVSDNGGQAPITYTYSSPTQFSTDMVFNSGNSIENSTVTLDTQGRTLSVQKRQGPTSSNYDTVSFVYDSTGHKINTSIPCTATIGGTCSVYGNATTDTFDGMNRVKTHTVNTSTPGVVTFSYTNADVTATLTPVPTGEHSKITQTEYDGLGRTLSVCAVVTGGLSGTGSCGQRTTGTGYLTKYTLDPLGRATQISRNSQAGATAVNSCSTYDLLSRITKSSVPESGGTCTSGAPSGTTSSFYYDTVHGSCTPAMLGHLNEITDPANNAICQTYDSMGRVASVFSPSGPNSANTNTRQFLYDSGTNGKGLLYYAKTCNPATCASAMVTENYFNYDLYGRLNQLYQGSVGLGNGNRFNVLASYYDNGAIFGLSGIPGMSNYLMGLDGEGRLNAVNIGPDSITAFTNYDSASNVIGIGYGNSDTTVYTRDTFSLNMTQAQFKIGAANTTDTHNYTWNPNGTLQQLQIVDNLTSTDTDTFNVTHDDLARITGYTGTHWSVTNSYTGDYAGNITKSGSISFNPGYVASNNHFASGSGCTYDANGNILHDCTLGINYTWDSFGQMVSEGGNTLLNDALGHLVEKVAGSTHTYYVQTPIGEAGTASSLTTLSSIKMPLTAGETITYDSAGNQQINHEDFRGSTVLRTNRVARTLVDVFCYGPLGEVFCGTPANSMFEGSFEDTSSGLADFDATRYSGAWGRSVSPTGGSNGYVKDNSPF